MKKIKTTNDSKIIVDHDEQGKRIYMRLDEEFSIDYLASGFDVTDSVMVNDKVLIGKWTFAREFL